MTSIERFNRCMHFQAIDHVPDMEFSFWDETIRLWEKKGIPEGLDTHQKRELYFGLERRFKVPTDLNLFPTQTVREAGIKDGWRYYYDEDMVLCRVPDDGSTTMPEHIEYSLKSRQDWERLFKPRLDPDTPGRIPDDLSAQVDKCLEQDFIPYLYAGSLFGRIRNYVGFAEICYMIYDDPELVDEMIGYMTNLSCAILERALPKIKGKVSHAWFWEDICFKAGPMISPTYFREHVVPGYRQIVSILKANGIDVVFVDCDGWIEPLVDCWLDAGINVMFPLERNGGSDPHIFRKKYGRNILLSGGIDKTKIAKGGDVIVRELEYIAPLVEEGGYIPHCDHLIPADVSLENFRFYLGKKREIFGIPYREERIREYPGQF
ncbi:MAG: uroporphyrinogen decarboxylase family protein [Candidatus Latescibacterota bacterium]